MPMAHMPDMGQRTSCYEPYVLRTMYQWQCRMYCGWAGRPGPGGPRAVGGPIDREVHTTHANMHVEKV